MSRNAMIGLGLAFAAAGLGLVLIVLGVFGAPPGPPRSPPWVGVLAGAVFVAAGLAMLVTGLSASSAAADLPPGVRFRRRLLELVAGVAAFAALASIASWVAFAPGPRDFARALPFLPSFLDEIAGRCVVGAGSLVIWAVTLLGAIAGWRKFRAAAKAKE